MKIDIRSIPHKKQAYDTCGDYYGKLNNLKVRISEMKHWEYEAFVLIHEMVEIFLCIQRGISFDAITEFDKQFVGIGEPGDSYKSPYRKEHQFATKIEKMLCKEMGFDWEEYDKAVLDLEWR